MSVFTEAELDYLTSTTDKRRLARLATVGADGAPHVVPTGFRYEPERDTIAIGGFELPRTKKFRDVRRSGRAAVVIDDLASTDPWRPRGIEIRGSADGVDGPAAVIRIHPERVISWGLESDAIGERHARNVRPANESKGETA